MRFIFRQELSGRIYCDRCHYGNPPSRKHMGTLNEILNSKCMLCFIIHRGYLVQVVYKTHMYSLIMVHS